MNSKIEEKDAMKHLELVEAQVLLEKDMNEVIGGDYDCYCQGSPAGQTVNKGASAD